MEGIWPRAAWLVTRRAGRDLEEELGSSAAGDAACYLGTEAFERSGKLTLDSCKVIGLLDGIGAANKQDAGSGNGSYFDDGQFAQVIIVLVEEDEMQGFGDLTAKLHGMTIWLHDSKIGR